METEKEKIKLVWWANAPYCGTGYGVGTKGVVDRLPKEKFDVSLLCFWGLEGRALILNDQKLYPKRYSPIGEDAAQLLCRNIKPHFLVTLFDIWIAEMPDYRGAEFFLDIHPRWIPWVPVDHDPSPIGITNQARKAFHAVTMCKFGKEALEKEGVENTLIPLGTDTSIFKPSEDKRADKEWAISHATPMVKSKVLPWSPDDFIIGVNAAPKDPVRKNFEGMFDAFKYFLEQNPDARKDARMYLHTERTFPGGWPLDFMAEQREIAEYLRVTNSYYYWCGYNEYAMSQMTRSWDVFFNIARREGFGIPIIEACACGVPPIVTNFTSMPELAKGHGWIVDIYHKEFTNLMSYGGVPDPFEAAECLAEAYNNPDKVAALGEKAREFSLDYDWTIIAELWRILLEKLGEPLMWRPLEERRIR